MTLTRFYFLMPILMATSGLGWAQSAAESSGTQTNSPAPNKAEASSHLSVPAREVLKLAQNGVGDEIILVFVHEGHGRYDLSATDIVALKSAGVSSPVLTEMINHDIAVKDERNAVADGVKVVMQTPRSSSPATSAAGGPSADVAGNPSPQAEHAPVDNPVVVPPLTPPSPQVEATPMTPGPDYIWVPGWWSWNGGSWIWINGYWRYPHVAGRVWFGGRPGPYWRGGGRGRYQH